MRLVGMVRRGVVVLVGGAVVSWVVAWGLAAYRPTDGMPNVFNTTADQWVTKYRAPQFRVKTASGDLFVDWTGGVGYTEVSLGPTWTRTIGEGDKWLYTTYPYPEDVPEAQRDVFRKDGWRDSFELPGWVVGVSPTSKELQVITSAWGWPMRCLTSVERVSRSVGTRGFNREHESCLQAAGKWTNGRVRVLPLRVAWVGMGVNAVFWGLVVVGPVIGVRGLRSWRRRRRGGCPRCGYSLEGLGAGAACPECGTVGPGAASNAPIAAVGAL